MLTKINSVLTLQRTFLNPGQYAENDISLSSTEKTPTAVDLLNKGEIEYADGKPRLESVLKFWNNYATNKNEFNLVTSDNPSTIITEKKNENNQETKRDLSKYQNPKAKDILNKVLSSFLIPKTTKDVEISTTQNSLLNNIYKELLSEDKTYKVDEINNKYSVDRILDVIESNYNNPLLDQNYPDMISQEYTTNNPYISFKEMLASIDKKTAYPFAYDSIINRDKYGNFEKESKLSNNYYLDNLFTPKYSSHKKIKKTDPPFPRDIIKDIADSVKAIILRDIRKEIETTMPVIITAPTTTSTTTISSTTESINLTTQVAGEKQEQV